MKILGRKISLRRIPIVIVDLIKMLWRIRLFKQPLQLVIAYFAQTSPPENKFELRSGHTIKLSSNEHDSLTVMVIFCRREYGAIVDDSIVIDIGANIGVFSLYAALNGASKVYAYEPNPEAFQSLVDNIVINRLENVIIPFNFGVSGIDNEVIFINNQSSPYNKVESTAGSDTFEINTISLKSILDSIGEPLVDLCKIDCEGAEYDVLFNTTGDYLTRIKNFRLEHHDPLKKKYLIEWFLSNGYLQLLDRYSILWFKKMIK
jgi:FkbM family methyltransferase